MKTLQLNEILKIISVVCLVIITVIFLFFGNKFVANRDTEIKIQKETHIANLIGQYNSDLNYCLDGLKDNKQNTAEGCLKEMNASELAKLITSWGYGSALMTMDKLGGQWK